jgi:uncharacterized membrane protein YidH (DUF202 family)
MRSPIEVVDKKLILPLSSLKTEFGFAFLYFGLLIGIKASDILDSPWLLGLWGILFLGALMLDLSRPGIAPCIVVTNSKSPLENRKRKLLRLGAFLVSFGLTLLLMNYGEVFFFRVESLFRIIHYSSSLANWVLLSLVLVLTNLLGALASLRKGEIAPYARLFPILALGIIFLKGVI